MNRHRANFSAMGPGFTENNKTAPTVEEFYKILSPLMAQNPHDAITSACEAIKQIQKEHDEQ